MTDLEQAMRDFETRKGVTVCAPVTSAKQAQELAKARREREREQARSDRIYYASERNAENMRYDREGVWYVGGYEHA